MYARVRVFRHLETAKGNRKGDGLLRESYVERKLTTEAKKRGGLAVKFVSPGFDGCLTVWFCSPAARWHLWN